MRVTAMGIAMVLVTTLAGCPFATPTDNNTVRGNGFSVTLPEGAQATGGGLTLDGTLSQSVYRLQNGALVYIVTLDGSTGLGVTPSGFDGTRYSGLSVSEAGDQLARAIVSNGDDLLRVVRTGLASGSQLYVASDGNDPEDVFDGIDVSGGDGSNLADLLAAGGVELLAPVSATEVSTSTRRVIVLDDLRVFELGDNDVDGEATDDWAVGDLLTTHDGSIFSENAPTLITRLGEWRSVATRLLGTGDEAKLSAVTNGGQGLRLSDGTNWTVLLNGPEEAAGWAAGDELVTLPNVNAFFGQTLFIRVKTGRVVVGVAAN